MPRIKEAEKKIPALLYNTIKNLSDLTFIAGKNGEIEGFENKLVELSGEAFIGGNYFNIFCGIEEKERIFKELDSFGFCNYESNLVVNKIIVRFESRICMLTGIPDYLLILNSKCLDSGITPLDKIYNSHLAGFAWYSPSAADNDVFYTEGIYYLTGYTPDEVKETPGHSTSLVLEDDLPRLKKQYYEFVSDNTRNAAIFYYRLKHKDKNIIWIKETIAAERDKEGKLISSCGYVSEINDLKETEIQLKGDNEHLKNLNDTKDKFISILSHDLRAPFTSILGFTEILMNEPNLPTNEKNEYLNYIYEASQNQLQLINYLLDWSKLQTGRIKLDLQRLNAQVMIYNCVSALTGNAIRKNIEIKIFCPDHLFVEADERLLTQVISNLISNAVKFSFENKIIEVSACRFNDENIEFIVKDEGTGIPDENKARLFKIERMFTTEGTKGEKGTGLGLSLIKEIVEKHTGNIWFYSEQGKGSEFHVTIPASKNVILIIEEDAEARKRYESVIRENYSAYDVLSVKNGYEALTLILKKLPSLIITSHDLPLMNGVQLLKSIRNGGKAYKGPVIALVNETTEEIERDYREYGANVILKKPVDLFLLNQKLQAALL